MFARFFENKKNSYFFVTLVALIVLLPGTFQLPLLDRDEPRFSRATVEMNENSNWIVPYFNGQYRFDKPPLTYWWMGLNHWLLGNGEFSSRLHSVLSTWLIALWMCARGGQWVGRKAASIGAICWLVNLQVWQHGRLALADMPMVLFVCLAMDGLWLSMSKSNKKNALGSTFLWSGVALGFLAKGPIAFAIPLLGFLIYFLFRRKVSLFRKKLYHLTGFLMAVFIVSLWGIPALLYTDGMFAKEGLGTHVLERGISAFNERSYTPFFYLITFFLSCFPWWLCGFGIVSNLKQFTRSNEGFYLFSWFLIPLVIFSFYSTQLPHYLLPGFPALFLVFGKGIEEFWSTGKKSFPYLEIFFSTIILALYFFYDSYADPNFPETFVPWLALILFCFIWLPYLFIKKAPIFFFSFLISLGTSSAILASKIRQEHLTIRIMKAGKVSPIDKISRFSKSFAEPSLVYYMGGPWEFSSESNLSVPIFQIERNGFEDPNKQGILIEGFNPARGKNEKVWVYPQDPE